MGPSVFHVLYMGLFVVFIFISTQQHARAPSVVPSHVYGKMDMENLGGGNTNDLGSWSSLATFTATSPKTSASFVSHELGLFGIL